ncbi:hypothetical protein HA052_15960 [Chromobacterium haemolyticum]|uniref:Uncharacterized protein n=1 Tax=Chromobacterium fluminis TaxID=3044269 RepID=A0ABX0L4D0_9NEIS|nr:hypothetical protein [Chromobacterium haemolyticum]NHR06684.1 hypothetical protein [Chromobacterium haemolyticum]
MKTTVAIEIDTDRLRDLTDTHLAELWHIAQANPVDIEDRDAGELVEEIGREIIRRFLMNTTPELWAHQGRHHFWNNLTKHCIWSDTANAWVPKAQKEEE